jgi:hypothetical protein
MDSRQNNQQQCAALLQFLGYGSDSYQCGLTKVDKERKKDRQKEERRRDRKKKEEETERR